MYNIYTYTKTYMYICTRMYTAFDNCAAAFPTQKPPHRLLTEESAFHSQHKKPSRHCSPQFNGSGSVDKQSLPQKRGSAAKSRIQNPSYSKP